MWNEPPPHHGKLADRVSWILANHRDGLSGRDIVAGIPVVISRDGIEVFLNALLSQRQSVAPTHGREIIADRSRVLVESLTLLPYDS